VCPQALNIQLASEAFLFRTDKTHTAVIISVLLNPALAKSASCDVNPSPGPGTPVGPGPVASIRPARSLIIGEFGSQDRIASASPYAYVNVNKLKFSSNLLMQ